MPEFVDDVIARVDEAFDAVGQARLALAVESRRDARRAQVPALFGERVHDGLKALLLILLLDERGELRIGDALTRVARKIHAGLLFNLKTTTIVRIGCFFFHWENQVTTTLCTEAEETCRQRETVSRIYLSKN